MARHLHNRVLIADDSTIVRDILRASLSNAGFDVCGEAATGVGAIESAKEVEPDLIILDLAMPLMNGAEAASVLKHMMPNVRLVLFTMYNKIFVKSLAASIGIDVVLSKVDGLSKLVECLRSLLGLSESESFAIDLPPH
jgi:DNA-binding NarL/FixJ family response regulator